MKEQIAIAAAAMVSDSTGEMAEADEPPGGKNAENEAGDHHDEVDTLGPALMERRHRQEKRITGHHLVCEGLVTQAANGIGEPAIDTSSAA